MLNKFVMMSDFSLEALTAKFIRFLIFLIPMLLGMVLHELAHGWTAGKLGDPTARLSGRLTLNPVKHLDPLGSTIFVLTALFSPFVFGWAKPVPVDFRYFKDQRKAMFWVSLSGPLANFLLALAFSVLLHILAYIAGPEEAGSSTILDILMTIALAGVSCNIVLAVFNLLPIPPMDGSKVLASFMSAPTAYKYLALERYGFLIVMVLLITGILGMILRPIVTMAFSILLP